MTMRFAMIWAYSWLGALMLLFALGLEAVPKALNYRTDLALAFGAVWAAVMIGPMLWVTFRMSRSHR